MLNDWTFSEAQNIISILELAYMIRQNLILKDSSISIFKEHGWILKYSELLFLGKATN